MYDLSFKINDYLSCHILHISYHSHKNLYNLAYHNFHPNSKPRKYISNIIHHGFSPFRYEHAAP